MFYSKKNSELIKYITLFGDHIVDDCSEEVLHEFKDRHDLCMQELEFWRDRENPERYQQALMNLLEWMFNEVEPNF
jgi:hypothetical protein